MPRISAATVAEHRAQQRRAVLDAARTLLAETGQAPSLAAVGARAGLARSSVYAYFSSRQDLLRAVVDEVLPAWADHVVAAMDREPTPQARVWAYVRANVELFDSSERAAAQALSSVVDPAVLAAPMASLHEQMRAPLVRALAEMGEPEPEVVAGLVGVWTVRAVNAERPDGSALGADQALALLRRTLGPWLGCSG